MARSAPEAVCRDAQVGRTFGGDTTGCYRYLDACVSELTDAQRAQWGRAVDACMRGTTQLYDCYVEVPWC